MRRIYFLIGGLTILAICAIAYFLIQKTETPIPPDSTGQTDPFGPPATQSPVSTTTSPSGMLAVTLKNGTEVYVPDFTKTNQSSNASDLNGYQISGSEYEDFQILFYPQNSGILVSLLAEPIGPVRLVAEESLRESLGLSNSVLCQLNIEVRTMRSVNETFSGRDLGLSFCPGATPLPK